MFDPETHAMICSRCYHINAFTAPVCVKCSYDAGTPVLKANAENLRGALQRVNSGRGPDPQVVKKLNDLLHNKDF